MAARYKDNVEFLLVYIREAHPTDGWQAPNDIERILLLRQTGIPASGSAGPSQVPHIPGNAGFIVQ